MRLLVETTTTKSALDTPLFSKRFDLDLDLLITGIQRSLQSTASWRIKPSQLVKGQHFA